MSFDEAYESFLLLAGLLLVAFLWIGVVRPFALRVVRASLYRLRDDLRRWYAELSDSHKAEQRFAFLFMERSINSVADAPDEITVWRMKLIQELQLRGEGFSSDFEKEIRIFLEQRKTRIKYIDDQHTLIFVCLLFINSPLVFVFDLVAYLVASIASLVRGTSPLGRVFAVNKLVRGVSHQQSPLRASI